MKLIRPTTQLVHPDEPAWSLREINLVRAPTHQWRRYQIVTVIRDDRFTEWWSDLGPKENHDAAEFEIPSLFEHTVAELWEIALEVRCGPNTGFEQRRLELAGESTLIRDFIDQYEERRQMIHNRSQYGPGGHKQRIGYPRRLALALEHRN